MKWEIAKVEQPTTRRRLECGKMYVSVGEQMSENGKRWQYMSVSFGRHADRTVSESMDLWPREAIALARAELDKFEASLEEERETSLEGQAVTSGVAQAGGSDSAEGA